MTRRVMSKAFVRTIDEMMAEDPSMVPLKEPLAVSLARAGAHQPVFDVLSFLPYLEVMKKSHSEQ